MCKHFNKNPTSSIRPFYLDRCLFSSNGAAHNCHANYLGVATTQQVRILRPKIGPGLCFCLRGGDVQINLRALEARRAHALKLPMNIYPSVDSFRESKSTDATAASVATFSSYALRGCAAAFDCRALSFRSSTCFLSDVCYFGTMRPALEFRHGVKFCT